MTSPSAATAAISPAGVGSSSSPGHPFVAIAEGRLVAMVTVGEGDDAGADRAADLGQELRVAGDHPQPMLNAVLVGELGQGRSCSDLVEPVRYPPGRIIVQPD